MYPDPVVERIDRFFVVRDDLIPGGTKQRVLGRFLTGADEFVYASPAYGYAQVALAHTCRDMGKQATVFVAKRAQLHSRTAEAKKAGAKIVQIPHGYLSNVKAKAAQYCEASGASLLPWGLDFPAFLDALAGVAISMQIAPSEVWTVAGSGTLSRALQIAWPNATFHAVQVGATPKVGRATLHIANEKFEQDSRLKPPFPSCSNYDAKAWQFVDRFAADGALFWNVAA